MKKLKVYLETSLIRHLYQFDAPEKMEETNALWEILKLGKSELYISSVVLGELQDCPSEIRIQIEERLKEIEFAILEDSSEVTDLASLYIEHGVLPPKSVADSLHIAHAVVADCHIITSWNFKHIVNRRTKNGVRVVNSVNNYREISILTASEMLVEEVFDE